MPGIRFSLALVLCAVGFVPSHLPAQPPFPDEQEILYGTWELDLERSVFIEREAPRRQVLIYEPHEEGLAATVVFEEQNGEENTVSYVAGQDGVPVELEGSENFDALIMDTQGPYYATTSFTHAGREVGRAERRISRDGREMTVEVVRMGNLSSRAVFVKQE